MGTRPVFAEASPRVIGDKWARESISLAGVRDFLEILVMIYALLERIALV